MVACGQQMHLRQLHIRLMVAWQLPHGFADCYLIAANRCKEIGHCRVHMVETELLDGGTMSLLQIERELCQNSASIVL